MPCVLNAANEVAVKAFLEDKIGFLQMSDIVGNTLEKVSFINSPSYDEYVNCDKEARIIASELV